MARHTATNEPNELVRSGHFRGTEPGRDAVQHAGGRRVPAVGAARPRALLVGGSGGRPGQGPDTGAAGQADVEGRDPARVVGKQQLSSCRSLFKKKGHLNITPSFLNNFFLYRQPLV